MPLMSPEEEERLQREAALSAQLQAAGFSAPPPVGPMMSQAPAPMPMSQTPIGPLPAPPAPMPPPPSPPGFAERMVRAQNKGYKAALEAGAQAIPGARPLADPVVRSLVSKAVQKEAGDVKANLAAQGLTSVPQKPEERTKATSTQQAESEAVKKEGDFRNDAVFADNPQTAPVSQSVTIPAYTQSLIDPKRARELAAAAGAERKAIVGMGEAGSENAKKEQAFAQSESTDLRKQADELRVRAQGHQREAQRYVEEIDRLGKETGSIGIDPDRYFKTRGTGQAVLDMLGVALSSFSNRVRGMPNNALESIDAKIDRDIMAQKQAIESKKGRLAATQGLLAETYRITGNLEQAESMYRGLVAQAMKSEAIALGAGNKSLEGQAATEFAATHYDKQFVEEQIKYEKRIQAQTTDASGLGKVGKEDRELSKDLEEAQIVSGLQAIANAKALIAKAGGEVPMGTGGAIGGLADVDEHGKRGLVANAVNTLRGAEARGLHSAISETGSAVAHSLGQRGFQDIQMHTQNILGNGSTGDVVAGLDRSERILLEKRANLLAGHKPETVRRHDIQQNNYSPKEVNVDNKPIPKEKP